MTTEGERRWPAEWESHKATIITYPHNRTTFRSNCEPAAKQYRAVARAIAQFEDVLLFCNTKELADRARKELDSEGGAQRIHILIAPSDDSWCRDSGPTFIIESSSSGGKRLVGLDWNFNAYGGPKEACYWPCNKDQALKKHICDAAAHLGLSVQCLKVPLVLEGGSIHTDGEGTVLTTEECLLNPNRNPDMTKQEIQNTILEALGCSKMIWLPRGIAADNDTNGHVDNFAMFARPGEVILSWCDDPSDENYDRCHEAMKVLEREVDAKGRKLTVHKLPCPPPMFYTNGDCSSLENTSTKGQRFVGERLAASYVNCYMAKNSIIVPQLSQTESDAQAVNILQAIFPDRKIVGVPSREILLGGGNIHCITQQIPLLE